jgi:hypothetical protein
MMDLLQLQARLAELGCYAGAATGQMDVATRSGTLQALTNGPDYRLSEIDIADAAHQVGCEPARIWAVHDVESSGNPFIGGRPTILFEPHRFSKATGHRFDASHPSISSPTWNRKLYPGTQTGRYEQLLQAVALDVDAGFASASYGAFQILGENHAMCDARSAWDFAWRMAQTEADQLNGFILFVKAAGLLPALRAGDWATFARGYNGTAYRENQYDTRLAAAYAKRRAGA